MPILDDSLSWYILIAMVLILCLLVAWMSFQMRRMDRTILALVTADRLRAALDSGHDIRTVSTHEGFRMVLQDLDDQDVGWDILAWANVKNAAIVGWREIANREGDRLRRIADERRKREAAIAALPARGDRGIE